MLVDPLVVPSSAQFNVDAAVVELLGRSRKAKLSINGYDIIIAMQKWQLEKGYFLHQSDGNIVDQSHGRRSWNCSMLLMLKKHVKCKKQIYSLICKG